MFKTIAAIIFAAVIIDISVGAPRATVIEASCRSAPLKATASSLVQNEPACIKPHGPIMKPTALRSRSQPGDRPRKVRIVAIDRLPPEDSFRIVRELISLH